MTDRELQHHVQNALDWEPSVNATDVGVTVDNGVITLRGDVPSYAEKETAERVALRVYGVRAVANDLNVRLMSEYERTDSEIAQAAANALKWNISVPDERLTITVREGRVTLKGSVDWQYQKDAAGRAVRDLTGVRGVVNSIAIQPRAKVGEVSKPRSSAALRSMRAESTSVFTTAKSP